MPLWRSSDIPNLSNEARLFAQQVARSVIEIEPRVDSVADIVVALEVLGYNKSNIIKYGFEDLFVLSKYVYDFIDAYEDPSNNNKEAIQKSLLLPIPDIKNRFIEAIGLIFPWLGSLILLFITGISLWLAWGLPVEITTCFIGGVFLGLLIAEGLLQPFYRLFGFYFEQTNISEVKRLIVRTYLALTTVLLAIAAIMYLMAGLSNFSLGLVTITVLSTVTISLHRLSFMTINGLKKISTLIVAYSTGFAGLLLTYYSCSSIIPDPTTRYFTSLFAAFFILSVFGVYHHRKVMRTTFTMLIPGDKPHFFNSISITKKTISSRFFVQLYENIFYSIFGIFYFTTMFTDRIIAWVFNPMISTSGQIIPIAFNVSYHAGADVALLVLLPSSIIQFIMSSPILIKINNICITSKITEWNSINKFIQSSYLKILIYSTTSAAISACIVNIFGPDVMVHTEALNTSLHILLYASIGNIFLSIFMINGIFVTMINRIKLLTIIGIGSTLTIILGGFLFGSENIENLTISYLIATLIAAITSTLYTRKSLKNFGSIFYAKFV